MEKPKITCVVLDILKPHDPPITEFAKYLKELVRVIKVEVSLLELDEDTETLEVIINGNLDFEALRSHIAQKGAVIHSIDKVIVESKPKESL